MVDVNTNPTTTTAASDDSLRRPDNEALREQLDRAGSVSSGLARATRGYALKRALGKFMGDGCTDLAAALTYYSVLSLFPALIALVSLLGVFGQGKKTVDTIMDMFGDQVPPETMAFVKGPIDQLVNTQAAGLALVVGLLGALWSASGYVGAFGRFLNGIYGVREGRPVWKLRPVTFLITALMLVLIAAAGLILVLSGGIATTIFDTVGLGEQALQVWNIAKWPVLLVIVIVVIGLLYQLTPNVKPERFRILTVGGAVAIVVMAVAVAGFGFYVSAFGSYNKTYGTLAGIIIFLMLIWVANLALLFGAEVDAEFSRARQLRAGIEAEEHIQFPLRDDSGVRKQYEKEEQTVEAGADLRRRAWAEQAGHRSDR